MSAAEQFVLAGVLERLRPEVALEIGTFQGGSLQVLSRFAGTVFSIDSDPRVQERLAPLFPGVRFHIGPSRDMIPAAFARMRDSGMRLGFALTLACALAMGGAVRTLAAMAQKASGCVELNICS